MRQKPNLTFSEIGESKVAHQIYQENFNWILSLKSSDDLTVTLVFQQYLQI